MQQIKLNKADLWKYADCEFSSYVGEHRVRVILKSAGAKHVVVCNYYHCSNSYKIPTKSFLNTFTLVQDNTSNV